MPFTILHDRIAVIAEEKEERTKSGLILTDEGYILFGKVTHVGAGRVSELNNERIGLDVKVGDRIFFPRAAGRLFTVEGVDYHLLTSEEIVGVMNND